MNCNYKVNIKDIQNKYKFNIFAMGGYNDSDLRKMIESVYYALPRTTASGTSVTLSDTAFSYMKNKLYATETYQYTTTGKNICELVNFGTITQQGVTFKNNGDGSITLTGQADNLCVFKFSTQMTLTSGTTYYINGGYSENISINFRDSGNTQYGTSSTGATSEGVFTPSSNMSNMQVAIRIPSGTQTNITLYPMVALTSGGDYEPYTNGASPNPDYPQVIHTINGDNTIKVIGRNLTNESVLNQYKVSEDSEAYIFQNNSLLFKNLTPNIVFKENTQYTIQYVAKQISGNPRLRINYTDGTAEDIGETFISTTYTKYTQTSNANKTIDYITETYGTSGGSPNFYIKKNSFCIVEGTDTTYYPYQSNSVLLTLGDKEICKIGDYEDKIFKATKGNEIYDSLASEEKATLDYGKWYLRKNIGKVVLDGSETNWSTVSTSGGYYRITFLDYPYLKNFGSSRTTNILCNNFLANIENNYSRIYQYENDIYFSFPSGMTTKEAFLQLLSTNNSIVYYILDTPTNELFNDTSQDQLEDIYNNMLSYEGQTNVSQVNDDLPFNINSTALKDLNNL